MQSTDKEFKSFEDRVKTCSVVPVLEVVSHPKVGATLIDYLAEIKSIKVDGQVQPIEIIQQTDGELVLKAPQVLPILHHFLEWDAKRTLQALEESFSSNGGATVEFALNEIEIRETVAETLAAALERLGEMADACLHEIVRRSPSGKKFVNHLATNYQNRNRAKELFFKEADALYAQRQLQPRD